MSIFEADVNYLAVLLAGLAAQPLGALWYSPAFLGRTWMRLRGYTEDDVSGGGSAPYVVALVAALLIAYALSRLVDMVGADSVGESVALALFCWAGLAGTVQAVQIAFNPKGSPGIFAIEGGYQLVSFLIMGLIIGCFQ